jgi:hypothetical protein
MAERNSRTRSRWIAFAQAFRRVEVALVVALLMLALGLLMWQTRPDSARINGYYPSCNLNLKTIALALHQYHEEHGRFPPPYFADKDGTPMHSWRVILLPALDEAELHKKYDFSEPWNGPNNSKLADRMPQVFGCPEQKVMDGRRYTTLTTDYMALVGPRAAFKPSTSRKLADFTDDNRSTIMVVEVVGSDVNWMEPRDLKVTNGAFTIKGSPHTKDTGIWSKSVGVYAAFVAGNVRLIPSNTSSDALKALTTIDGNEPNPAGL